MEPNLVLKAGQILTLLTGQRSEPQTADMSHQSFPGARSCFEDISSESNIWVSSHKDSVHESRWDGRIAHRSHITGIPSQHSGGTCPPQSTLAPPAAFSRAQINVCMFVCCQEKVCVNQYMLIFADVTGIKGGFVQILGIRTEDLTLILTEMSCMCWKHRVPNKSKQKALKTFSETESWFIEIKKN